MEKFVAWVIHNKEWVFSGVGVALVVWLAGLFFKKTSASTSQTIRAGDGSTNIQAGRDVSVRTEKKVNDVEKT